MAQLQALSLGHGLDPDRNAAGTVHSVFAHTINLAMPGQLWTVAGAQGADLPLGLRVRAVGFGALALRRGDRVTAGSGRIEIAADGGMIVIDCAKATRWRPDRLPPLADGLGQRLALVAAVSRCRAWQGSEQHAFDVVEALDDPRSLGPVLPRVVGSGPGATPSGDDVIAGVFSVLDVAGGEAAEAARSLRLALRPLLATTTDLGAHLLRQAAAGLFSRAVHELLAALIGGGDLQRLHDALRRVVAAGATSGADLCAGLLAAAPRFLLRRDERMLA